MCGERGIRTPGTRYRHASLANWWFQPLTHLSEKWIAKVTICFNCTIYFFNKTFFDNLICNTRLIITNKMLQREIKLRITLSTMYRLHIIKNWFK